MPSVPSFGRNHSLVDETRQQLQLAAAVAAESVLAQHVRFALELLDEGADRAPVERLLAAYARLHHLSEEDHRQLAERVLVALGQDPANAPATWLEPPRSVFRRAANRMRGRVHMELRAWVDRHSARVELAVLEVHVEHAMHFARILHDQGPADDAVTRYAETLELRATIAEMVRLRVLAEAPLHRPGAAEAEEATEADIEPLHPRPAKPLRLAEDGG